MRSLPAFTTPREAIAFLHRCLAQNDPNQLYTAFIEPVAALSVHIILISFLSRTRTRNQLD